MKDKLFLIFIVLIAIILRFYQLGQNPPSLDWDEASSGYNAYSILKTGADEYGTKWPVAFRSFDDYKPPAYVYLTVPSVALFGLNEFSVRLPSALFGVLAVVLTYFLVREIFKHRTIQNYTQSYTDYVALLASFLLAISPWHLQFSRAAFEANIGLTFFIGGVLFLVKGLDRGKLLVLSMLLFVFALYSYHSLRLVIPIFFLGFFFIYRKDLWQQKKHFIAGIVLVLVLTLPILFSFIGERGSASRFSSVSILKPTGTLDKSIELLAVDQKKADFLGAIVHNRRIVYTLAVIKGYLDHWDFNFLFMQGDGIERHHALNMGMLYLFELPFLLWGIYYLLQKRERGTLLIFWWFLIAPVASSISSGTPHPVRALVYLPTFQIFVAVGIVAFLWKVSSIEYQALHIQSKYVVLTLASLFFIFNFLYYVHQYYVHTPVEYSQGWQYGYREVVSSVSQIEDKYDKIIVTYKYDQPYIFFLFYNRIDPLWYQKNWDYLGNGTIERERRIFGKYEFRNIRWGEDEKLHNALIIGTPDEIPREVVSRKDITFLDGTVAFRLVERN